MKYRSRTEIVGLILEAANGGGATKTKIMYKAFLSFAQLREYLTMLQDNELIEYDGGKLAYRTTEKGMKLLELYENMSELVPPLAPTVEGKFASIGGYYK
jgi:predicted transcriptional regulator